MIMKKQKTKQKLSSEERKAQILAAARTLFAKKGYAEATLDDIADKVGISRPRIIQLFGSKQNIYETIAKGRTKRTRWTKTLPTLSSARMISVCLRHSPGTYWATRSIAKIARSSRSHVRPAERRSVPQGPLPQEGHLDDRPPLGIRKPTYQGGAFKDLDPRTIIFCYQAMISNLAIYKNVMKQMEFVTIEELSRECARMFLEGYGPTFPSLQKNPHRRRKW